MLDELAEFAQGLPVISRPIIHQYFRQQPKIRTKPDQSPVTSADEEAEHALRRAILTRYPNHNIIGEEAESHQGTSPFTWVLDPIDGTRAFVSGNPLFGTLIAVLENGMPKIGIIDLPILGQCWHGQSGKHAQRAAPTQTSTISTLKEARLATTSPQLLGAKLQNFNQLAEACYLTNYGGDCANYAHLASGWCDLVVETNLNAYDIMAVVPVIESAGGVISQWDGAPITLDDFDGSILAAATPKLHAAAKAILL